MRAIKFRVWDKINKQFHYWGFGVSSDDSFFTGPPMAPHMNIDRPIQEQFTGLYDKNGKEIYEGDILHTGQPDDGFVVVEWDEKAAMFKIFSNEGWDEYLEATHDMEEVVGNIHEHPEPLEDT